MGKKIFVSYKYADNDVKSLSMYLGQTTAHHYVQYMQDYIFNEDSDHIYKGEKSEEDLSDKSDNYIREHLKDKIFDSTITIVLISPNMKEYGKRERNQWIPWEISYSVSLETRNDRTSHRNALLAVILPDHYGSYNYLNTMQQFRILQENINNNFAPLVRWDFFKAKPDYYLQEAFDRLKNTDENDIVKSI